MESYFSKIVAFLLAVLIFFIFPIYTSYEKKDDIAHAMASKSVHLFVDTVRNKGYVAPRMYDDFMKLLTMTGNSYDVKMEHTKKRYDPVVYIYGLDKKNGNSVVVVDEMSDTYYKENVNGKDSFIYRGKQYSNYLSLENGKYVKEKMEGHTIDALKRTAKVSTEVFGDVMITNKLYPKFMYKKQAEDKTTLEVPSQDSDVRKYMLSVGDNFEVSVRNTNTTLATVIFYAITSQRQQYGVPKIYISYGGVVRNELIKEEITADTGTPNNGEEFPDIDDTIISGGTLGPAIVNSLNVGESKEFGFTESTETFMLSKGTYQIEAWGAEGGGVKGSNIKGGRGGYVDATFRVEEGTKTIEIIVGGKGGDAGAGNSGTVSKLNANGGYNGGGKGSGVGGAGGGGATEIKLLGEGLENRILVAAGGGGNTLSAEFSSRCDGGLNHTEIQQVSEGESGCMNLHVPPYGNDECGGGAGIYGGKTVHGDDSKYAYGGLNYINTGYFINSNMHVGGMNEGNGKVIITRIE